jgi:hypothetical protein
VAAPPITWPPQPYNRADGARPARQPGVGNLAVAVSAAWLTARIDLEMLTAVVEPRTGTRRPGARGQYGPAASLLEQLLLAGLVVRRADPQGRPVPDGSRVGGDGLVPGARAISGTEQPQSWRRKPRSRSAIRSLAFPSPHGHGVAASRSPTCGQASRPSFQPGRDAVPRRRRTSFPSGEVRAGQEHPRELLVAMLAGVQERSARPQFAYNGRELDYFGPGSNNNYNVARMGIL